MEKELHVLNRTQAVMKRVRAITAPMTVQITSVLFRLDYGMRLELASITGFAPL